MGSLSISTSALLRKDMVSRTIGYPGTGKKRFLEPNILNAMHLSLVIIDRSFQYELVEQHCVFFSMRLDISIVSLPRNEVSF